MSHPTALARRGAGHGGGRVGTVDALLNRSRRVTSAGEAEPNALPNHPKSLPRRTAHRFGAIRSVLNVGTAVAGPGRARYRASQHGRWLGPGLLRWPTSPE